jgi:hypothetical protein
VDLEPFGTISSTGVEFFLKQSRKTGILAEAMFYAILGTDSWGSDLRYGLENPFAE